MARPRWMRYLIFATLTAWMLLCMGASAWGQSAAPGELLVKVASAKYLPEKAKIEYTLENDGQSAVTAYSVEISTVIRGRFDSSLRGPVSQSRDLLMLELGRQCRGAGASANDEDYTPWAHVKIPPGIILPGKERTDSVDVSTLLPNSLLQGGTPEVSVRMSGVIWADGRIEGKTAIQEMQVVRDGWVEAAREEHDVLAVLKAHEDDGDYQHRLNAITDDLRLLMEGYPREVPVPEDEARRTMYLAEPGLVSGTIRVIQEAAYLPNPLTRIQPYADFENCVHERRAELQAPAMAAKRR